MPPEWLSMGRTASVNRMIPMPPSHWVRQRHRLMPCDRMSTEGYTVAPVVENPDMVSKNASVTLNGVEHIMNGSMPNSENTTHTSAVSRKPSRLAIEVLVGRMQNVISTPVTSVTTVLMKNESQSSSEYIRQVPSGHSMKIDSMIRSQPSTRRSMGKLICRVLLKMAIAIG